MGGLHGDNMLMNIKEFFAPRSDRQPPALVPSHSLSSGLSNLDLAVKVREGLYEAKGYARWRRRSWRRMASSTHILVLGLSAAATVVLGLADLDGLGQWGFVFSALVTTVSAVEPFFNWRSRWVLAEEALAKWHRLEEDLATYVAATAAQDLQQEKILEFYSGYCDVWEDFSNRWIEQRRAPIPKATP